jgi:hypothetical protein
MGDRNSRGDIYVCFGKGNLIDSRMGVGEINLDSEMIRIDCGEKLL